MLVWLATLANPGPGFLKQWNIYSQHCQRYNNHLDRVDFSSRHLTNIATQQQSGGFVSMPLLRHVQQWALVLTFLRKWKCWATSLGDKGRVQPSIDHWPWNFKITGYRDNPAIGQSYDSWRFTGGIVKIIGSALATSNGLSPEFPWMPSDAKRTQKGVKRMGKKRKNK